jgi:hypothetical protein
MRFADDRREHLRLTSAPGGYSKSLPRSGVFPTSLARVLGSPQKLLSAEFRVSPRHFACGVSLAGGDPGGVGVDERVEGASGRPPNFVLLDVDQVEQAAQICPPIEPHGSVASFHDLNQAPDEEDGVRMVFPLAVSSVYFHGDRLVHALSPRRGSGQEGEGRPRPNPRG